MKAEKKTFTGSEYELEVVSLTKRDWFAGMALQGLLANGTLAGKELYIKGSVAWADALIKELEKE